MIESTLPYSERIKVKMSQQEPVIEPEIGRNTRRQALNNSYSFMDMPIDSIENLAKETVSLIKRGSEPRLGENNVEALSKAIRKAELLYLSIKGAALKSAADVRDIDAVLSHTIKPSECTYANGIFRMEFPFLMPHRSSHHKTKFFAYQVQEMCLDLTIDEAFKKELKYVIIEHHYPEKYGKNYIRDNDNTEDKWLLDALIGTVLIDDGPGFCTIVYKTVFDDEMKTVVYVGSKEVLIEKDLI